MNRVEARSERYSQIERLLLTSREPMSRSEIARRTGVHRATIGRMEQAMMNQGIPIRYDDRGRLYIERMSYLSTIRLRLDEAVALYLAARLLARYSDKPNANVTRLLEKLGTAVNGVAPAVASHIMAASASMAAMLPAKPPHEQTILETLGRGWADGRVVHITYRPLHARRSFEQPFAPYFLEPSGIGFSVYAIGLAGTPGLIRTRKLDRIERAVLTDQSFAVPRDFDPNKLLAGAWAIWFDDADRPQTVQLRFSHHVAKRVRESYWHPSQRIEEDLEGRLIWTAEVDAVREMMPWIRGWGADVEVLEPNELRHEMQREVLRLVNTYNVSISPQAGEDGDDVRFASMLRK